MVKKLPSGTRLVLMFVLVSSCLASLLFCDTHKEKQLTYDLNQDGTEEYYHLARGRLTVTQSDGFSWLSPAEWDVRSFALDDITGDSSAELIILLWKKGSFGNHKPVASQENTDRYSCHLFLYQMAGDQMIPRWCSSALDKPIKSFDIIKNGQHNILTVEEGKISFYGFRQPFFIGLEKSCWEWKEWGFYRTDKITTVQG